MHRLNSFEGEKPDNLNKSLEQPVTEQGNRLEQAVRDVGHLNQQAVTVENPQLQKNPELQAPVLIPQEVTGRQKDPRLQKRKNAVKPSQGAGQQSTHHSKPTEQNAAINQQKDSNQQKPPRQEPPSKNQEISQTIEAELKTMSCSQASATTSTAAEMLLPKRPLPLSLTDKLAVAKASPTSTTSQKSAKAPAAKPHKSTRDLDEMEILLSKKQRGTLTKPGLGSKKDEENLQM